MWLRRLDKGKLHPGLVAVMEQTLETLSKGGDPFKVYSGLRTFEEQDKLYAQGRTAGQKGAIVTKAKGGQSMHNYGLAVDLAPFNMLTETPDDVWWPDPDAREGQVWFSLEAALFEASQSMADSGVDYEWGGRWKFRDVPHVQVRTTSSELREGYYPHCDDVEWLVKSHTTFLFDTEWMTRRVQRMLNDLGFAVGTVDGSAGRRTLASLGEFQVSQGLDASSVQYENLTGATVERLVRAHHGR